GNMISKFGPTYRLPLPSFDLKSRAPLATLHGEALEDQVSGLLEQAFAPELVVPMMAGTLAFPWGRGMVLRGARRGKFLNQLPPGSLWGMGMVAGFGAEVSTFTGVQGLWHQQRIQPFFQRWQDNFQTLGVLKAFGGLGHGLGGLVPRSWQGFVGHGFAYSGLATLAWIHGEAHPGVRALGDYLALSLGGYLGWKMTGAGFRHWTGAMEIFSQPEPPALGSFGPWALASAGSGGFRPHGMMSEALHPSPRSGSSGKRGEVRTLDDLAEILGERRQSGPYLKNLWLEKRGDSPFPGGEDLVLVVYGKGGGVQYQKIFSLQEFSQLAPLKGEPVTLYFRPMEGGYWLYRKAGNRAFSLALRWYEGNFGKVDQPVIRALLGRLWGRNSRQAGLGSRVTFPELERYLQNPDGTEGNSLSTLWRYQRKLAGHPSSLVPEVLYLVGHRNGHHKRAHGFRLVDQQFVDRVQRVGRNFNQGGNFFYTLVREGAEHQIWRGSPVEQWFHRYEREKRMGGDAPLGSFRHIPRKKPPQISLETFKEVLTQEGVREEFLGFLWSTQWRTPWPPHQRIIFLGHKSGEHVGRLRLYPEGSKRLKKGRDDFSFLLHADRNKGRSTRIIEARGPGSYDLAWAWLRAEWGAPPRHSITHRLIASLMGTRYNLRGRGVTMKDVEAYFQHLRENNPNELHQYLLALGYFDPIRAGQLTKESTLYFLGRRDKTYDENGDFYVASFQVLTPQELLAFKKKKNGNGNTAFQVQLERNLDRWYPLKSK
ncbi:MAG: hypothetical protein R3257_04175, partial [bacterium]|nr:hypothetical protein [bacterium]